MITKHNYALAGDDYLQGLSTDTKPTSAIPNSLFLELDTGDFYYYDGDQLAWAKIGATAPTLVNVYIWEHGDEAPTLSTAHVGDSVTLPTATAGYHWEDKIGHTTVTSPVTITSSMVDSTDYEIFVAPYVWFGETETSEES